MTWSLVTYRRLGETRERAGALHDGGVYALPMEGTGVLEILDRWDEAAPELERWSPANSAALDGVELLAPLRYPPKIMCAGANYRDHVAEMGVPEPAADWEPWFFLKAPSATVIGPTDSIRIDPDPAQQIDWEGELGVVIGRRGSNIAEASAANHVAGYVVLNDVSARGPHRRAAAPAEPFQFDWVVSKSQDTFCPMGPGVTPSWFVPDPHQLHLRLWVNDELKQDSSTSQLIQDCWQLVAGASRQMTLEPGDVIATGTPAGVGAPRGTFLAPGDVVTVEIERLGRIENPVEAR